MLGLQTDTYDDFTTEAREIRGSGVESKAQPDSSLLDNVSDEAKKAVDKLVAPYQPYRKALKKGLNKVYLRHLGAKSIYQKPCGRTISNSVRYTFPLPIPNNTELQYLPIPPYPTAHKGCRRNGIGVLAFLTAKDLSESFRQFLASANTFERNSLVLLINCRIVFELFGIGKLVTHWFCNGICRGFSNTSQFCVRPYIYARA